MSIGKNKMLTSRDPKTQPFATHFRGKSLEIVCILLTESRNEVESYSLIHYSWGRFKMHRLKILNLVELEMCQ